MRFLSVNARCVAVLSVFLGDERLLCFNGLTCPGACVERSTIGVENLHDRSDDRRERFVSLCPDVDVQRLTFEAYMNKKLVKARPMAHLKIGIKNLAHLTGLVSPLRT